MRYNSLKCVIIFVFRKQVLCHYFNELYFFVVYKDISHNQFNEFKEKYGVPKNNEILITAVGTLANTYLVNTNYDFYFKDGNLIWLKD